ncbi:MAG: tetraacyldisaccharide 4'-kinase [Zoogloeaceae bacterium]|nr:tetraacyldisaccharide 4'-kinase [Zoogloeaceae bacterium]
MRRLAEWLTRAWFQRRLPLSLLWAAPVAFVFFGLAASRRALYRRNILRAERLPVPVIVIGNVTLGGAGKTPLTLAIAEILRAMGYRPGMISRGYRGQNSTPRQVFPDSSAAECGDEPVLLARRSGLPVWIGRDRAKAGKALLAAAPSVDVILCDDGLQHYSLQRDLEIAVFDGRGAGNGWLLPAGPLREPVSRLASVGAIVTHGDPDFPRDSQSLPARFAARFTFGMAYRLGAQEVCLHTAELIRRYPDAIWQAVAGMGNPARFFRALDALGFRFAPRPFPDHHSYHLSDLGFASAGPVIMTEKDAVKCAALGLADAWVLPVSMLLPPEFPRFLKEKLNGR